MLADSHMLLALLKSTTRAGGLLFLVLKQFLLLPLFIRLLSQRLVGTTCLAKLAFRVQPEVGAEAARSR